MTVLVFPGQGCQYDGMGADLFDRYPDHVEKASEVLGYCIRTLCLSNDSRLHQTQFTQPALFFVNALAFLDQNRQPDYLLGHSVGEYNALHAAGAISLDDALRLVQRRGELMQSMSEGSMAAVLGLEVDAIEEILIEGVEIANHNTPTQIVVSGRQEAMDVFEPMALKAGAKRFVRLQVSGAFHSSLMQGAAQDFEKSLQSVSFHDPQVPVVANVSARPYVSSEILKGLVSQIGHRVRWVESIEWLLSKGEKEFIEINAAKPVVLKLIKQICKSASLKK